ncbi:N-acetylmuramoyl-L-alanine amidase [Gaiella occulta]|uniref:N-acetylmuramoyl-L-alanine amidase n=1 Tax=Gaiella occulta TaxID=1002870 RepID=A0A7M2YVB7_9ACTN|nr:N-acetylmuramoyl-L-alanine amidase [Gaiella occulta]RDI74073.1 N-acetylmuramoyl-L-alanine amidase [Gaiella occulta]
MKTVVTSIIAVTLAALALPAAASAGLASLVTRDVPLHGERLPAAAAPTRFDLVGLRWRGSGTVSFQVRSVAGRWGAWLPAAPEAEDLPDARSAEARAARGWQLGNPTWVGPSTAIRYRTRGTVTALRASFVRSPELRVPLRTLSIAGAPPIVPRSGWGADESIRHGEPEYASAVRYAIVHHTAGTNSYSPAEAAAIMRGIELYHVKANGWNDIGYNFLVDRYGTVYEGRYGGIDRNVVAAHAKGFNTGSVGVAVIGTFSDADVTPAAESALTRLLAWRLDLAHVDPLSTTTVVSGGSERFPVGVPVLLRAVSGHRDTGLTVCPGNKLYARLDQIAAATQAIGLPKIYEPSVTGGIGALVRFRARVSGALPWTVTVTDPAGLGVASGTGVGPSVDWTWDASLAVVSGARWRIAVAGATAASGVLGKVAPGGAALAVTGLAADPETISPNGDGQLETSTITYTTTADASVTVSLLDAAGRQVAELAPAAPQPPGEHALVFDGLGQPDGVYTIAVTAIGADGTVVTQQTPVTITRTLGEAAVRPAVFTPNGDGSGDELQVRFQLAAAASVRVRVLREGKWVATPFSGPLAAGPQLISWDGSKRIGRARDGSYTAVVEATDAIGTTAIALPFVTDAHPPLLRLLAGRPARLWVSEAATVTVRVNGAARVLQATAAGPLPLAGIKRVRSLVAVGRDVAGNRTVLRFAR